MLLLLLKATKAAHQLFEEDFFLQIVSACELNIWELLELN